MAAATKTPEATRPAATGPAPADVLAGLPTERLEAEIVDRARGLARGLYELLVHIGEADARGTYYRLGALSCAAWLADTCDLDLGTAYSYVRVARALRTYPTLDTAMAAGHLSYAKARALCPHLTDTNATELVELARSVPAAGLGAAIATWSRRNETPDDIDTRHHRERFCRWHTNPDGMIVIVAKLPPHQAAPIVAAVDQQVMSDRAPAGATLGQQRADALSSLATNGGTRVDTEVVIHVDGTATHLTDGTPISEHAVAGLLPDAFISLLLHDSHRRPIDASPRRRTPTRRQRRVLQARQPQCNHPGCSTRTLLQTDHIEPYTNGGQTILDNLQQLCGPHNRAKGAT